MYISNLTKGKVLLIIYNFDTRSLKDVGGGESFGFSTLLFGHITIPS